MVRQLPFHSFPTVSLVTTFFYFCPVCAPNMMSLQPSDCTSVTAFTAMVVGGRNFGLAHLVRRLAMPLKGVSCQASTARSSAQHDVHAAMDGWVGGGGPGHGPMDPWPSELLAGTATSSKERVMLSRPAVFLCLPGSWAWVVLLGSQEPTRRIGRLELKRGGGSS
ncbi:hypothetical protein BKA66DRAFT_72846 [Pyrenochaeta sp. MPI-SDFR-AT-0127]|nr:hypothetical protein BKA66DRAFT_72846 [Pyrenochaeta sp. MPI-SDFR-AT-0127]